MITSLSIISLDQGRIWREPRAAEELPAPALPAADAPAAVLRRWLDRAAALLARAPARG
jgi:hypothetical protein